MNKLQKTLFCAGFGYVAECLSKRAEMKGVQIIATTRSEEKANQLRSSGVLPLIIGKDDIAAAVPEQAHWLISAPPEETGCPIYELAGAHAGTAAWIGYLSTTGVYGDRNGGWVFEWSNTAPNSTRGERRVHAEQQWLSLDRPAHLFRLPGIYGPGRSAFDRLDEGNARRIIKKDQVFSRVHVDDIVRCLLASMSRPNPGRVYYACDDEAAPPQDVIEFAARLAGYDVPPDLPIEIVKLSPMARSFYDECKRVSNARTKSELGWTPKYPTYREGLKAILKKQ